MIARIRLKRLVKRTAGWAGVLMNPFHSLPPHSACILMYHRLTAEAFTDPQLESWNVPPSTFERQIGGLAPFAEFVALGDLHARLAAPVSPKPLVCLTFDDGYANFLTQAVPVLVRYGAKATSFVVTGCVGKPGPMPFDRWGRRNAGRVPDDAWRAMDWGEVERCIDSGVVTFGAHSHRHLNAADTTEADLVGEAEQSRAIMLERLGEAHAFAYAFPYGSSRLKQVTPSYVAAIRRSGFRMAVSTDLGLADRSCDPFLLPRVEVHATDTPTVLRAKVCGSLAGMRVADQLRAARRTG